MKSSQTAFKESKQSDTVSAVSASLPFPRLASLVPTCFRTFGSDSLCTKPCSSESGEAEDRLLWFMVVFEQTQLYLNPLLGF